MNIEKITSNKSTAFLPGIVDIFLAGTANCYHDYFVKNIASVFGTSVINKLAELGISLGYKYGSRGIDVFTLMASSVDPDDVYEICPYTFGSLTKKQQQILCKHNVIVHDLMEGGHLLDTINTNTVTGCIDSVPIFLLCTIANSIVTGNISKTIPHTSQKQRAIVPIHKARPERLDMLEMLYQENILRECDWSLYLHDNDHGVAGDFLASPNLSTNRWSEANSHPFVRKHKHLLPKVLDTIPTFAECLPLNKKYHGVYKWHIACETYQHRSFITEKTFKAFIGGHIPLTVAPPGFNKCIEQYLGFKMPGDYDHLSGISRVQKIAQIVKRNEQDYTEIIQYNHTRIMSVDTVSEIIANSINRAYCF